MAHVIVLHVVVAGLNLFSDWFELHRVWPNRVLKFFLGLAVEPKRLIKHDRVATHRIFHILVLELAFLLHSTHLHFVDSAHAQCIVISIMPSTLLLYLLKSKVDVHVSII